MAEISDLDQRLTACFQLVFPDLSIDDIAHAEYSALDEWDSLASISLVAVIEEEFDIMLDDDVIQNLTSFVIIREMLCA